MYNTKNYSGWNAMQQDIVQDVLVHISLMFEPIISTMEIIMRAQLKSFYASYTPSWYSNHTAKRRRDNGGFSGALTRIKPHMVGNKIVGGMRYDPNTLWTMQGTSTDGGPKPYGSEWGTHTEYPLLELFYVLDEAGWTFQVGNQDGQPEDYYHKPAKSVKAVINHLNSKKFKTTLQNLFEAHGYKSTKVRR